MSKGIRVDRRESGLPGGGAGRRDYVGKTGVYRVSGPQPHGDAPIIGMAEWGQGERGAAGYADHGDSELIISRVVPEKCRDIMTKDPVCCLATDTADHAARLMAMHSVGVLPVVASLKSKKLVGVVTDRDLVMRILAKQMDPAVTHVEAALSEPAAICFPEDSYETALELMEKRQIKRVLVIDSSEQVVGIISESDVALRLRDRQKTGELIESIAQPMLVHA